MEKNKKSPNVLKCILVTLALFIGLIATGSLISLFTGEKVGVINSKGEVVIPLEYDDVCFFSEGIASVGKDGKYDFVNKKGESVEYNPYCSSKKKSYNLEEKKSKAVAEKTSKWGLVNKDGKCGFLNEKGEAVLPLEYNYIEIFNNNLAIVEKDGKYGVVNEKGKVLIPAEYDKIGPFENDGLAIVEKDFKYGVINEKGKVVVPLEYTSLQALGNGFFKASKWGWKF